MADILSQRVVKLQSGNSPVPFFFFPPMHGGSGSYNLLINQFGADQTCYGFHSRGLRDVSVQQASTIQEIAEDYLQDLLELQPDGPYYLIGWSLGALTALEVGHRLKENGKKIGFVGSVDVYFKAKNFFQSLIDKSQSYLFNDKETVFLYQILYTNLTHHFFIKYMGLQNTDDKLKYLGEECRKLGYFGNEFSTEQITHILRIRKANLDAAIIYEPKPDELPLVYTLASEQMPIMGHTGYLDYLNDIRPYPTVKIIHGADHLTIINQPFVSQVAKFLRSQRDSSFRKHGLAQAANSIG